MLGLLEVAKRSRAGIGARHIALVLFLLVALLVPVGPMGHPQPTLAFGGENPIVPSPDCDEFEQDPDFVPSFEGDGYQTSQWHHQDLSYYAALAAGFDPQVACTIAWHTDYLDSYNYSPLWWFVQSGGGIDRFKVSLATKSELDKMHFDNLFTVAHVNAAWNRYFYGTVVALLWAESLPPRMRAAVAQHVLGTSLHAVQDFYSHSNWVDDPARRNRIWFDVPEEERATLSVWTGYYGAPLGQGIKPHGVVHPQCSVIKNLGAEDALNVACMSISPLSNTSFCQMWRRCRKANTPGSRVDVEGIPGPVVYLSPPGMALDTTWQARVGVRVRGLSESPMEMFLVAKNLAYQASVDWLQRLESTFVALGKEAYWREIQTTNTHALRTRPFEAYDLFPYMFMTVGPYPPEREDYYLRVEIETADETNAGTDADIFLRAGGKEFRLDYLAGVNPLLAYNDFEQGDKQVYYVGPFEELPDRVALYNDAPDAVDVLEVFVRDVVRTLTGLINRVVDFLKSLVGADADWVTEGRQVWEAEQLQRLPLRRPQAFSVLLDGRDEGVYRVRGEVTLLERFRNSEDGQLYGRYRVRLNVLECISEADWDRGSNSDEPFLLWTMNPFPGQVARGDLEAFRARFPTFFGRVSDEELDRLMRRGIAGPYSDVDDGEVRSINVERTLEIPEYGALVVAFQLFESDDESAERRQELLEAFAQGVEEVLEPARERFLSALGAATAGDWKVRRVRIFAFRRAATLQAGLLFDQEVNRWIKGEESLVLLLDPSRLSTYHLGRVPYLDSVGVPLVPDIIAPQTPSPTATPSPVPTLTATPTLVPTVSPTWSPTSTPSPTPTFTPSPTATPTPTNTPTPTPTATATPTPTPTPTPTATPTPTPTATPTPTPTRTVTPLADTEGPLIGAVQTTTDKLTFPPCEPNRVAVWALKLSDISGVARVETVGRLLDGQRRGEELRFAMAHQGGANYAVEISFEDLTKSLEPPYSYQQTYFEFVVLAYDGLGNVSKTPPMRVEILFCVQ